MKKAHSIAVLFAGYCLLLGTGCNSSLYSIPQTVPKVSAVAAESRIPLSFSDDTPIVDVMINGEGPYPFILDLGSPISIIGSELAEKLKLKVGTIKGSDIIFSASGVDAIRYKQIESLVIGHCEFGKFDCIESTKPFFNNPDIVGIYGTLGIGVFSNALIILNYPEQTLIIKDEYLSPEDPDSIPTTVFSYFNKWILFEGTLNGNKQKFALCAGSSFGLYLDNTTKQEVMYLESPRPYSVNPTSTGLIIAHRGQMNGYIEFGRHRIENPMVYIGPQDLKVISKNIYYDPPVSEKAYPSIGGRLLEHFELSIDQRSRLLRLRRLHQDPIKLQ